MQSAPDVLTEGRGEPRPGEAWRAWSQRIVASLLLLALLRSCTFQGYYVPSASMVPALLPGDYLLVSRLSYGVPNPLRGTWLLLRRTPQVGDVVVFTSRAEGTQRELVKRVVAVEGEVVSIRGGLLFVNGRQRDPAPMVDDGWLPVEDFGPLRIPEGSLFVLGDNRGASLDSRAWGVVPLARVSGRGLAVYWSWDPFVEEVRWDRIGEPL